MGHFVGAMIFFGWYSGMQALFSCYIFERCFLKSRKKLQGFDFSLMAILWLAMLQLVLLPQFPAEGTAAEIEERSLSESNSF